MIRETQESQVICGAQRKKLNRQLRRIAASSALTIKMSIHSHGPCLAPSCLPQQDLVLCYHGPRGWVASGCASKELLILSWLVSWLWPHFLLICWKRWASHPSPSGPRTKGVTESCRLWPWCWETWLWDLLLQQGDRKQELGKGVGHALKTDRRMEKESRHAVTFLSALLKSLLKWLHLTEIRVEDRWSPAWKGHQLATFIS